MQLRQLPTNLKNGQAGQSKTNGKFKLTTDPMQPKEKPQSNSDGAPHMFTSPSLFEFNNDVCPAQSTAPLNWQMDTSSVAFNLCVLNDRCLLPANLQTCPSSPWGAVVGHNFLLLLVIASGKTRPTQWSWRKTDLPLKHVPLPLKMHDTRCQQIPTNPNATGVGGLAHAMCWPGKQGKEALSCQGEELDLTWKDSNVNAIGAKKKQERFLSQVCLVPMMMGTIAQLPIFWQSHSKLDGKRMMTKLSENCDGTDATKKNATIKLQWCPLLVHRSFVVQSAQSFGGTSFDDNDDPAKFVVLSKWWTNRPSMTSFVLCALNDHHHLSDCLQTLLLSLMCCFCACFNGMDCSFSEHQLSQFWTIDPVLQPIWCQIWSFFFGFQLCSFFLGSNARFFFCF